MMQQKPLAERDSWISCRATTAERMLAEQLQNKLNLKNQSELVRHLLNAKAEALGIS